MLLDVGMTVPKFIETWYIYTNIHMLYIRHVQGMMEFNSNNVHDVGLHMLILLFPVHVLLHIHVCIYLIFGTVIATYILQHFN